jgi:putative polymerase
MDYARLQSPPVEMGRLLPLQRDRLSAQTFDQYWVLAIMVAAVTYQALLCLINTKVFGISRAMVGLGEAVILAACLPILARRLLPGVIVIATLMGALLCLLTLISGEIQIKAFRDLIIPLCFFWLGCNIGRPEIADRALTYTFSVVLVMGLIEFFFLDLYTEFFNIFSYYVNIGNLQVITEYVRDSKLQMNGIRPEGIGRTLLPGLLGSHRVSSVFLEPVSLGNFAALTAAWGLSRDREDWRKGAFFVTAAIVLMVLSDSRFALMSVSIMVAMRLVLSGKGLNLAILAPFGAIAIVLLAGAFTATRLGDNFLGRLAISGWALMDFDVATLLGASPGENFADQGYAYVLSTFSLPLCLLLWFSFWFLKIPDERGQRFRAFASIYIALILCVSGTSLFAFKTAAVLWFLVGCTLKNPAPESPAAQPLIKRVNQFYETNPQVSRRKDVY